jgi:flagella basal body P-ring formation protein FlgA
MSRSRLPLNLHLLSQLFAALAILAQAPQALAEIRGLPVPAATIYPGDTISSALLVERQFRVTAASIAGIATNRAVVIGKQPRRRLLAGKPIPLAALGAPVVVRRGAAVSASYMDLGLSISASLVALRDGVAGDMIDARNAASGVIVRAVVRPDGTLQVSGE